MRTLFLAVVVASFTAWSAPAALVGPPPDLERRVGELSAWIVENSDYALVPATEPLFVFLSAAELYYIQTGRTDHEAAVSTDAPRAGALYIDGIIFLRDDFDVELHEQVLLHELVHHFQARLRPDHFACRGEREAEAYALQGKFAEARGQEQLLPGALVLVEATTCRGDR